MSSGENNEKSGKMRKNPSSSFDPSKAINRADVISDPRFQQMQSDPRFMTMRQQSRKVKIDSRFKKMFEDENFRVGNQLGGGFESQGRKVDKFGRKTNGSGKSRKELTREGLESYYDLDEEVKDDTEEEDEGKRGRKKPSGVDRRDLPEMDAAMQAKLDASRDRMRGVGLEDSSSSSSSDDEEDSSESETSDDEDDAFKEFSDGEELSDEGVLASYAERRETGHESSVPEQDATKRLALVNCEWQQIRAVDILTILRSFCPSSGEVNRVTVYPSDFGLERMKEENVIGPMGAVAKIKKSKYGGSELSQKRKNKKSLSEFEFGKEGKEIDNEQLRQYERDRLKYYYAIIECDSVKTAKSVYEQCDGLEFERSSALLDLRYVPNDQGFSKREVRDVATDTPEDYEPPEFEVKALRNATVKLSWDDADPARKKTFGRKITEDKLKDDDFNAYLASDSEEDSSDDEEEEKEKKKKSKREGKEEKKKYLAALLGKDYKSKTSRTGVKLDDIDKDVMIKDQNDNDDDDFFLNEDDDTSDSQSSSSEEIEDTALASTKYAMQKKFSNRYGNKSGKNGNSGDMEVTFHAGLEDFGTKMKKKKKEGTLGQKETAEERRERERREKKLTAKKKKEKEKNGEEEEEEGEEEEFAAVTDEGANGFDDPFFAQEPDANFDFDSVRDDDDTVDEDKKKSKKKKRGSDDGEDGKAKAELELLMMDENVILGRGDAQSLKKNKSLARKTNEGEEKVTRKTKKARLAEKRKLRGKAARRAESDDEMDDDMDDEGKTKKSINVQDERFGALFENHEFALDPTDPRYKDVESKALIASEREKRRAKKLAKLEKMRKEMLKNGEENVTVDEDDDFPGSAGKKKASSSGGIGKNELDSMIQSLKRKQALAMQKKK